MQELIDYVATHLQNHLQQQKIRQILELLDYIAHHLEEVVAEPDVFKHPQNNLIVQLKNYESQEQAREKLTSLIAEVKTCFTRLSSLPESMERQNALEDFFTKMNDSAQGCMEERLRVALSSPSMKNEQNSNLNNNNDFIANDSNAGLDAVSIKESCINPEVNSENDLLKKVAIDLNSAHIIEKSTWMLYCFKTQVEATQQLQIIQSLLKESHLDLVQYGKVSYTPAYPQSAYRFRLTLARRSITA